jgi:uncharacterized protein
VFAGNLAFALSAAVDVVVLLPLVGPLATASRVPRDVAAGGLHELEGRRVYVSRGVGVERGQAPRLRIGAVPDVSLITLR